MEQIVQWEKLYMHERDVLIAQALGVECEEELGIRYLDQPDGKGGFKERFGWTHDYTLQKIHAYGVTGIKVEPVTRKKSPVNYTGDLEEAVGLAKDCYITMSPFPGGWRAAHCNGTSYGQGGFYVGATNRKLWQEAPNLPEAVGKAVLADKGYKLV